MNKKICLLLLGLFFISFASAQTSFYVERGSNYTVKVSCENGGNLCSTSALCNLTISYPNSTILRDNEVMANLNNGFFALNITNNETTPNGEYSSRASCVDGTRNSTTTFIYEVNPAGIRPSDQKTEATTRGIYFMFGLGILFFLGFLFVPFESTPKWTMFILSFIFFLISLDILFVSMQDEAINPRIEGFFDAFTQISFILYWFLGGLLAVIWVLTFINEWVLQRNIRNMKAYGLTE